MNIGIVLAGGLKKTGELPEWVISRCVQCLEFEEIDIWFVSSRYTLNIPQKRNKDRFTIYENVKIAEWLIQNGICKEKIYLESCSVDTIGSALFCRLMIDALFENYKHAISIRVITSDFHSARALEIFRWAFALKSHRNLKFKISITSTVTKKDISERAKKEQRAKIEFLKEWSQFLDVDRALSYLLQHHDNYSISQSSKNRGNTEISFY